MRQRISGLVHGEGANATADAHRSGLGCRPDACGISGQSAALPTGSDKGPEHIAFLYVPFMVAFIQHQVGVFSLFRKLITPPVLTLRGGELLRCDVGLAVAVADGGVEVDGVKVAQCRSCAEARSGSPEK
jgi:hypothetical protein